MHSGGLSVGSWWVISGFLVGSSFIIGLSLVDNWGFLVDYYWAVGWLLVVYLWIIGGLLVGYW